jgi:hypothetical protein
MQSFDGDAFEPLGSQPHIEGPLSGVDEEHYLLASQGLLDIIGLMIDGHAEVLAHSPRKRLPLERVQPRIGVHRLGQGRQA